MKSLPHSIVREAMFIDKVMNITEKPLDYDNQAVFNWSE